MTVSAALSDIALGDAQQILVEKQSINCFQNPNLPEILNRLGAERCVVYGVVTEICVRHAALGLLQSGRKVELVTDAVRSLDEGNGAKFLSEFQVARGRLTTLDQVVSR